MSCPSSSKGKNLADDTRGAYADEVITISISTCEDDGVEAHHYSSSSDDDGEEAHVPFYSFEDDHIHFSSEDGEGDHASSSTRVDDRWVSKMKEKSLCMPERLKLSCGSESCSIHRVPYSLRKHNEDAYNPQLISIGPFHYEKRKTDQLRSMKEHEWNYLHDIISRTHHPRWLEECYVKIKRLEKKARNCYSEETKVNINDFDFLEMMVLDGCFIVEFLRRSWLCRWKHRIFPDDVIIQLAWPARALWCDLLLLENQIPFFILQKLSDLMDADLQDADIEDTSAKFPPLVEMALNFIFPGSSTLVSNSLINKSSETPILHLLHLLYVGWVPKPTGQPATEDKNLSPEERKNRKGIRARIPCASTLAEADKKLSSAKSKNRRPRIPSASKLKEAGIGFKRMDDSDSLGIRFHNGVIEIPKIHVSDFTKKKFLNLIAFEQCYVDCTKLFTNFATFMDSLIDTAEDVEILHDKGIIYNDLGDNGLVASEFSSIAREESISYDPVYLTNVCAEINEYKERCWPRSRASFVHDYYDYCRNPWALVSVIAGILLLLFAFTQTFFTSFPKFAYKNGDLTRNPP